MVMSRNGTRAVISVVGLAAVGGMTLISGFSVLNLVFGMCGGDGGYPYVPHESTAGRFCDSPHLDVYLLAQFAVPILLVAGSTVWAVVRVRVVHVAVGIVAAVATLVLAAIVLGSLSAECDYPVQESEECDTY